MHRGARSRGTSDAVSAHVGQDNPESHTSFSRLSKDASGTRRRGGGALPKPTHGQSALEIFLFAVFGLLILLAGFALYQAYSPRNRVVPDRVAEGVRQDRINILFIGYGGSDHPSGDTLADSLMLVSLKPSTRQVAITSIPRDLWVHIGRYGTHRINFAHEIGEQSGYPGAGPGLLCDTVSEIFGQPVHAFVRIDFKAFETAVDDLGGVEVYCQRGFYDYLFNDGFERGWHHLDGRRALAYARYRYVVGPEGDNFAREMRQQQLLSAVRAKAHDMSAAQAVRLVHAVTAVSSSLETNLTTAEMANLYNGFHDVSASRIRHVSLKPFTTLFMVTRIAEPGEAVQPRTGNYAEFQALERNIFNGTQEVATPDEIQFPQAGSPDQRAMK